jgi:hypothetical protein
MAGETSRTLCDQRGIAVIALIVLIPALLAMTAIALAVSQTAMVKSELQAAADAAATAGAADLPDEWAAKDTAQNFSRTNTGTGGHTEAVHVGNWNETTRVFQPNVNPVNAVRVITRRVAGGNPVDLLFGPVLGMETSNVEAMAVAMNDTDGGRLRFLLDEEMFDSDIPVLEDLADELGFPFSEAIIMDRDGDWFIDIPPGTEVELPTGQSGDEGVWVIDEASFRFTQTSDPSIADFLNFNENGSWRQDLVPKSMLDPLIGVNPATAGQYAGFVNPDAVLVSPVFKSDVSRTGRNKVNALGERRGLVAFSIIGVGSDPDGSGSRLPNLILRIIDGSTIDLDQVQTVASSGGGVKLVK